MPSHMPPIKPCHAKSTCHVNWPNSPDVAQARSEETFHAAGGAKLGNQESKREDADKDSPQPELSGAILRTEGSSGGPCDRDRKRKAQDPKSKHSTVFVVPCMAVLEM